MVIFIYKFMFNGGINMLDKIIEIVAEKLNVDSDDISLDTSFVDDLQADSLDMVELVMCLEDELGFKVDDDKLEEIKTVKDVLNLIEENN